MTIGIGRGRFLGSFGRWPPERHNQIDLEVNKLSHHSRESVAPGETDRTPRMRLSDAVAIDPRFKKRIRIGRGTLSRGCNDVKIRNSPVLLQRENVLP